MDIEHIRKCIKSLILSHGQYNSKKYDSFENI